MSVPYNPCVLAASPTSVMKTTEHAQNCVGPTVEATTVDNDVLTIQDHRPHHLTTTNLLLFFAKHKAIEV